MSTNHDGPKPSTIAHMGYSGTAYAGMKAPAVDEPYEQRLQPKQAPSLQPASVLTQSATNTHVPGYESLYSVLEHAYSQAARGKGQERHARQGEGFEQQPIFDMARRFGVGSLLAQAFKKMDEAQRLGHQASQRELLGAIVYIAAACIHNENQQNAANGTHGN